MEGRAFLLKIDGSGAKPQFWEYLPLPPDPEEPNGIGYYSSAAYAVQVTADGYIFAGEARGSVEGPRYAYVVKTDLNGGVVWQTVYDYYEMQETDTYNSGAFAIQIADDGYIAVGSSCYYKETFECGGYILKIKPDGKHDWEKQIWPGAEFNAVQVVSEGYIVAGTIDSDYTSKVYLVKTGPDGEQLNAWQFGDPDEDAYGNDVWIVDGAYIIAGTISTQEMGNDAYLIKISSQESKEGEVMWEIAFGGPYDDAANAVRPFDGGYVIAGTTTSSDETVHMYLAKISIDGLVLGEKSFVEEEAGSYANSMQVTPDNGFIIAGYGDPFEYGVPYDVLLLKTDATELE
jgi:hypothetical protein